MRAPIVCTGDEIEFSKYEKHIGEIADILRPETILVSYSNKGIDETIYLTWDSEKKAWKIMEPPHICIGEKIKFFDGEKHTGEIIHKNLRNDEIRVSYLNGGIRKEVGVFWDCEEHVWRIKRAVDNVVNSIEAEIDRLSTNLSGRIECSKFLNMAISKMLEGQETLESDTETGILHNHLPGNVDLKITPEEVLRQEEDFLGVYIPMSSPGKIILYGERLRSFFWQLVDRVHRSYKLPVMKEDLAPMARMVALGTYHHEYFHFFCDIQRKLFPDSQYNRLTEEALAVAYARSKVIQDRTQWNSVIGRMTGFIYRVLLVERFKYTADGYRNWPDYADSATFGHGLVRYVNPPGSQFLHESGVRVNSLLAAHLNAVYDLDVPAALV